MLSLVRPPLSFFVWGRGFFFGSAGGVVRWEMGCVVGMLRVAECGIHTRPNVDIARGPFFFFTLQMGGRCVALRWREYKPASRREKQVRNRLETF